MKFRVWSKYCNAFIEDLSLDIDGNLIDTNIGLNFDKEYQKGYIIQFFTGLLDKNKREIYEGDIVKFKWERYEHDIEENKGEVFFEEGIFYFNREMQFAANDCNFLKESLEIIGNVTENGRLLK